jgi:hypothetical protein
VIIFSLLILLGCIIFATAIFIMLRQKVDAWFCQ